MRKVIAGITLITGLVVAVQMLPAVAADSEVKDDRSVGQAVWGGSGGMDSGEGNYMGNCLPCHGMEGKGDGPLADSLGGDVLPRDLSDAAYMSSRSNEELFNVIKHGGKSASMSENMPDWSTSFNDKAIQNLVAYIRKLCNCEYEGASGD
ncbi:MAG: cytochrome c [Mariprofundaceae bacterium]